MGDITVVFVAALKSWVVQEMPWYSARIRPTFHALELFQIYGALSLNPYLVVQFTTFWLYALPLRVCILTILTLKMPR